MWYGLIVAAILSLLFLAISMWLNDYFDTGKVSSITDHDSIFNDGVESKSLIHNKKENIIGKSIESDHECE